MGYDRFHTSTSDARPPGKQRKPKGWRRAACGSSLVLPILLTALLITIIALSPRHAQSLTLTPPPTETATAASTPKTASAAAIPVASVSTPTATLVVTPIPTALLSAAAPTASATSTSPATATATDAGTPTTSSTTATPTATGTPTSSTVPTPPATQTPGTTSTATSSPTNTATTTPTATTTGTTTATATGTTTATPTITPTPLPVPNDDVGSATLIGAFPFTVTQDTTLATLASDDPDMGAGAGRNSKTVWYRFVAPASGSIRADTHASDYDTVLAAWTGSRGQLALAASNDDLYPSQQSEVAFNVQSGATYYLEIAGYGDGAAGGHLNLNVRHSTGSAPTATSTPEPYPTWEPAETLTPTPTRVVGPPPPNDDIASAVEITTLPFTASVDTTGATSVTDDPNMGVGQGANSFTVWYRFTATTAGALQVHTQGSDYDTVLAVFAGSPGSLTLVANNDDASPAVIQAEVAFQAQAGVTYYIEVAQYGSYGGGQLYLEVVSWGGPLSPATLVTPSPAGTTTPQLPGAASPVIPTITPRAVQPPRDDRYFSQTGFRIDDDRFWDYFQKRGNVRAFGYPISWDFPLLGFKVQLFQRAILQLMPNGTVVTMNLLDEGMMPYSRVNGSSFPMPEREFIANAPSPKDQQFDVNAIAFVTANVPDRWDEMDVNFLKAFLSTVTYEDAFPEGKEDRALVPLLNLELWGLPTSKPAYDPNNRNFVYQRFQRGILHYDSTTGTTQGLLLADHLKAIVTGLSLPPDLETQATGSRFYRQFDPTKPGHLARPTELPGTNLTDAFKGGG